MKCLALEFWSFVVTIGPTVINGYNLLLTVITKNKKCNSIIECHVDII